MGHNTYHNLTAEQALLDFARVTGIMNGANTMRKP